jgi:hypothetical protein
LKNIRLYLILGTILFAVTSVACKKSIFLSDYRDQWLGRYNYDLELSGWQPDTIYPVQHQSGVLFVEARGNNSVIIRLENSARWWQCEVADNGHLTLVKGDITYWREFEGCFPESDSLYINCSYFSPGSGARFRYFCNK